MDELDLLKHMEQAMYNSFNMIVKNSTLEEIMLDSLEEELVFIHDIENGATVNDLHNLRDYFTEVEDFEKCIELTKLIDKNG